MTSSERYSAGMKFAWKSIDGGYPRWALTNEEAGDESIDLKTGLPILSIDDDAYIQGHNDAILEAIKSGEITVDFRPLLMKRAKVLRELRKFSLGTLSVDRPRVESSNGDVAVELRFPRPKVKSKHIWVVYWSRTLGEWPDRDLYDEPVEVALGLNGRVLILGTASLVMTHDVATSQVLNLYMLSDD